MPRPIIEEQLKKCQFADLNNFYPPSTFIIKKYSKPTWELNKCYLAKLPLNIVNKPDSVLASNWNNGASPGAACLKIYISKVLGKMIYVDGLGYDFEGRADLDYMWSGWLDSETLTQVACI